VLIPINGLIRGLLVTVPASACRAMIVDGDAAITSR
jgi:hypothetical protein